MPEPLFVLGVTGCDGRLHVLAGIADASLLLLGEFGGFAAALPDAWVRVERLKPILRFQRHPGPVGSFQQRSTSSYGRPAAT